MAVSAGAGHFKHNKEKIKMSRFQMMAVVTTALVGALLPVAKADEWDQKTTVTFSGPVEIPGQVLSAGTYVFKLADSEVDRNIVQVFSKNEKHLYGTILAIPDYRLQPSGKPVITFEERAEGAPEAVKAWFFPGENYGHDFVYPKVKAVALARANSQPVPSMPSELAAGTTKPAVTMKEPDVLAMKRAPLKAQRPTEEVEIAEVFAAPHPAAQSASASPQPEKLPRTASLLPLIGLAGLLSLGGAAVLRIAYQRSL
jgi:hypothetical protein